MRKHIRLLQIKPGFQAMTLHQSLDGKNIVVYAQWSTPETFQDALIDPQVQAARAELDTHGQPEGRLYRVEFIEQPVSANGDAIQIIASPTTLVFVNVWLTKTAERQRRLLTQMMNDSPSILKQLGSRGMAFHTSLDGSRLVVYALWDSLAAFNAAITNNEVATANRNKLAQWGESSANTY